MRPWYQSSPNARPKVSATAVIVGCMVAGFMVAFFTEGRVGYPQFVFLTSALADRPWSVLTYPLAYDPNSIISILFSGLWLWGVGHSLENELGSRRLALFFGAATALAALCLWVGALGLDRPGVMSTAWTPVAALTVAWGTRNPSAEVRFMFVLPLTGKWLAWLAAALVFFGTTPQLAIFAALPLLGAYFYASNRIAWLPWAGASRRPERKSQAKFLKFQDEVNRRARERAERERLKNLLGDDDDQS